MLRPSSRCLAMVVAATVAVQVDGETGAVPQFRGGHDVALRDSVGAHAHASPPVPDADSADKAVGGGTYTQFLRIPGLKLPGYLSVQVADTALTGRLFLGGRRFRIKGELGEEHTFLAVFNDATGEEVACDLSITIDQDPDQIYLNGNLNLTFDSDASTYTAPLHLRRRVLNSGHAGSYTLSLPPDLESIPKPAAAQPNSVSSLTPPGKRPAALAGCGYGLLRVTKHGAVRATVVLADGYKAGLSGYFDPTGNVAVFGKLYTSTNHPVNDLRDIHGYLGGVFRFRDRPHRSDAQAVLRWMRPSAFQRHDDTYHGFSVIQPVLATRFERFDEQLSVLDGIHHEKRDVVVSLEGGGLPGPVTTEGMVSGDYVKCERPNFHAEFSPGYGIFSGNFNHPGTHGTVKIRGVVLQKQGRAFGLFFDQFGRSGSVVIEQAPKDTTDSPEEQ